ncbi:MAG TPA: TonB family protein [Chitinophagaceae bacterium]|nr:TonB family protein [Chitinophagaceae bacterium]
MKPVTTLFICVLSFSLHAQKKESFYDYQWKPCNPTEARFYSTLEKTDSGWFRNDFFIGNSSLQMQALYEDEECKIYNGRCIYFHANGKLQSVGIRHHNKEEGPYVRYYSNGMMADSASYHDGIPVGSRMRWHRNGFASDSIYHANDSMDVQISWFDDGQVASAGYLLHGKLYGKWKYFYHGGSVSAEELYDKNGKIISKTYYGEDGTAVANETKSDQDIVFKKGGQAWQEYLRKNLYWPRNLEFNNGNMAVVVVEFTVNEQGKVEDEEVVIPFHPEFDRIALSVIHNSPAWTPRVAHNRKVKTLIRQPVTFQQEEN